MAVIATERAQAANVRFPPNPVASGLGPFSAHCGRSGVVMFAASKHDGAIRVPTLNGIDCLRDAYCFHNFRAGQLGRGRVGIPF